MDKRLKVNQSIEIVINYGQYEGNYAAQVVDIIDEDNFVVTAPFQESKVVNLSIGIKMDILLSQNNGMYKLPVKVVNKKRDTTPLLVLSLSGAVSKIQEREFFRLDIYQETTFQVIGQKDDLADDYFLDSYEILEDNQLESYNSMIRDISASGLKLSTLESVLSEGQIIAVDFSFATLDFDKILAKVIRVNQELKSGERFYVAGLEFVYKDKGNSDKILQWLFAKQREMRRKGLI